MSGEYMLLAYNLVARTMDNPVACHGYALFEDGVIVTVRPEAEAGTPEPAWKSVPGSMLDSPTSALIDRFG